MSTMEIWISRIILIRIKLYKSNLLWIKGEDSKLIEASPFFYSVVVVGDEIKEFTIRIDKVL